MSTIEIQFVSRYHFFDKDKKILVECEFLLECQIGNAINSLAVDESLNEISFVYLSFVRVFIERNMMIQ